MVVDGSKYEGGDGVFINHSCAPNAEYTQEWLTWVYGDKHGAHTDFVILPIIATKYVALCHITVVMFRGIEEGEEITISYSEDYKKSYHRVPLNESVTTGFPLTQCRCGARYCVGEITRAALRGIFHEDTVQFLEVDQGNRITVDRHLINLENRDTSSRKKRAHAEDVQAKIMRLQEVYDASCVLDHSR